MLWMCCSWKTAPPSFGRDHKLFGAWRVEKTVSGMVYSAGRTTNLEQACTWAEELNSKHPTINLLQWTDSHKEILSVTACAQ